MGEGFDIYIEHLELIGFFSAFPLLFAILQFAAGRKMKNENFFFKAFRSLPVAYALVATLFICYYIRSISLNINVNDFKELIFHPLKIWAFLGLLFYFPAFQKKPVYSLIHSLVFFLLVLQDFYAMFRSGYNEMVKNDMQLYTFSFLINLSAVLIITAIGYGRKWMISRRNFS